jgi:hypothetical protein
LAEVRAQRSSTILGTFPMEPARWYCVAVRQDGALSNTRLSLFDDTGTLQDEVLQGDAGYDFPILNYDDNTGTTGADKGQQRYLRVWGDYLTDAELLDEVRKHPAPGTPAHNRLDALLYSLLLPDGTDTTNLVGSNSNITLVNGSLSLEEPPTFGPAGFDGGIGAVEQGDTAAFSGSKTYFGSIGATEQADVAALAGTLIPKFSTGTLGATEQRDTFASTGDESNPGFDGGIGATEQRDTAAFSGAKTYFGSIGITEARDLAAFSGTLIPKFITGSAAILEQLDDADFFGDVSAPGSSRDGSITATEQRDVGAFAGSKTYFASIAALESRDAGAFMGTIIPKFITGTVPAVEVRDNALFLGDGLEEGTVGNTLAIRDANTGIGISPETTWSDGAPSWARDGSDGSSEFPMAIGQPQGTDNWDNNLTYRQMRLIQAISDTPPGADVIPGWGSYVGAKTGEWVWCVNRTDAVADNDNPAGQGNAPAI